MASRLPCVL